MRMHERYKKRSREDVMSEDSNSYTCEVAKPDVRKSLNPRVISCGKPAVLFMSDKVKMPGGKIFVVPQATVCQECWDRIKDQETHKDADVELI